METQEMLDFCGKHKIVSDIERVNVQQINEAYNRFLMVTWSIGLYLIWHHLTSGNEI
jgi:D-arabinose 1-dehydrogenase-like Zn-dependent alcohol dehydrogenase